VVCYTIFVEIGIRFDDRKSSYWYAYVVKKHWSNRPTRLTAESQLAYKAEVAGSVVVQEK
jgi:hypothetical protein